MAELLTLARPYAKAAFDFAAEQGQTSAWADTLSLAASFVQDRQLAGYLARPDITATEQVSTLVNAMGGQTGTDFRNFLTQLADNGRLSLIPAIETEFQQLKNQHLQETAVTIESAFPLTQQQETLLASRLGRRFGGKILPTIVVNPDLLGGVLIRAGDQVIDDSVRGKLDKLRTQLLA
jgi:F-type H+-transporting ATPase subunit delta